MAGARRVLLTGVMSCWTLSLLLSSAQSVAAQVLRQSAGDSASRVVESVAPLNGAPGAAVSVVTGSMPARTSLRVGFGTATGFEELEMVLTNDLGEFSMQARVPPWASWERSYRFIVFDVYFRPIALSAPFVVTDSLGRVRREGSVEESGPSAPVRCTVLREVNGETHELVGSGVAALNRSGRVQVVGRYLGPSTCAQGLRIEVPQGSVPPTGG